MAEFDRIMEMDEYSREDVMRLLTPTNAEEERLLFKQAHAVKKRYVGETVYLRGLIEISNICEKNCYYCGIRKGNLKVKRYLMDEKEILSAAEQAFRFGYGSVVIQSGESSDERYISFIESIIRKIKYSTGKALGVTLSLGEQDKEVYRRWFEAGAHRYLLRIETSNRAFYRKLHPEGHSFDRRLECLYALKEIGYQLGTGVMIDLPGQTVDDLAGDILFFKEIDADMIGMGPYIPHSDTPLSMTVKQKETEPLTMTLRMIAATRIVLKDVNIASTTALQAIDDTGREQGLKAGANVIMPNMTPVCYRDSYRLYDNKPCMNESSDECRGCLESRILSIGETIGYNQWGDSPHFQKKREDVGIG
jgi:biotin synthase